MKILLIHPTRPLRSGFPPVTARSTTRSSSGHHPVGTALERVPLRGRPRGRADGATCGGLQGPLRRLRHGVPRGSAAAPCRQGGDRAPESSASARPRLNSFAYGPRTSSTVSIVIDRMVPMLGDGNGNETYGRSNRCGSVRSSGLPVIEIDEDPAGAPSAIVRAVRRVIEQGGAEVIIVAVGRGPGGVSCGRRVARLADHRRRHCRGQGGGSARRPGVPRVRPRLCRIGGSEGGRWSRYPNGLPSPRDRRVDTEARCR